MGLSQTGLRRGESRLRVLCDGAGRPPVRWTGNAVLGSSSVCGRWARSRGDSNGLSVCRDPRERTADGRGSVSDYTLPGRNVTVRIIGRGKMAAGCCWQLAPISLCIIHVINKALAPDPDPESNRGFHMNSERGKGHPAACTRTHRRTCDPPPKFGG